MAFKALLQKLTHGNKILDRYLIPFLVAISIALFHRLATAYPVPLTFVTGLLAQAGITLTDATLTMYLTLGLTAMATLMENHISVPGFLGAPPAPLFDVLAPLAPPPASAVAPTPVPAPIGETVAPPAIIQVQNSP